MLNETAPLRPKQYQVCFTVTITQTPMSVQVEVIIVTVMREQPVQILLDHICVRAKKVMKVMEQLAVFQQVNG